LVLIGGVCLLALVGIRLFADEDMGEGISGVFGTVVEVGVSLRRRPIDNLLRRVSLTVVRRAREFEDMLSCAKVLVTDVILQTTEILGEKLTISHLAYGIMTLAN
jgi:hypothetical protein